MVWTYLGIQHGPTGEVSNSMKGRGNLKKWALFDCKFREGQKMWAMEMVHASRLCVLDYLVNALRPQEENLGTVDLGRVFAQVFEREIFKGQRELQCWGVKEQGIRR